MPGDTTSNSEPCYGQWLKLIETLVSQMLDTAEEKGGITVAYVGQKRLPDGRVVEFSLKASVESPVSGGAHKLR